MGRCVAVHLTQVVHGLKRWHGQPHLSTQPETPLRGLTAGFRQLRQVPDSSVGFPTAPSGFRQRCWGLGIGIGFSTPASGPRRERQGPDSTIVLPTALPGP